MKTHCSIDPERRTLLSVVWWVRQTFSFHRSFHRELSVVYIVNAVFVFTIQPICQIESGRGQEFFLGHIFPFSAPKPRGRPRGRPAHVLQYRKQQRQRGAVFLLNNRTSTSTAPRKSKLGWCHHCSGKKNTIRHGNLITP